MVAADDLEKMCDLGRGAYGIVEKMKHIPSGTIMAVKVILFLYNCFLLKYLCLIIDYSLHTTIFLIFLITITEILS